MTNVTDPAVVKAMAHPVRVRILGILEQRDASPTQLADEIGLPLANVSYHVKQLRRLKLIELVREERRRGAIEHYYRLETRPSLSDESWAAAPSIVKEALSQAFLDQLGTEVEGAAAGGSFEREDVHLSRLPVVVDEKGFQALAREAERFMAKVLQIEQAAGGRIARHPGEPTIDARAVIMLFEAAGGGGPGDRERPEPGRLTAP